MAVTTSIVADASDHDDKARHQQMLAVDRVRHGSHQEPEQHIGDHAQHGEQSDERRRSRELVGEDGDRDKLKPTRNARQAADRPQAAIVGSSEEEACVGGLRQQETERVGGGAMATA